MGQKSEDAEWSGDGRGSWLWLSAMVLAFWVVVLAGVFYIGRWSASLGVTP